MLSIGVEFGTDRPDGTVWIKGVDDGGAWARAGGTAGDLCIAIDGVPAANAIAEWQSASRPRLAGEQITVELERLGERLTISPRWEEAPTNASPSEDDEIGLVEEEELRKSARAAALAAFLPQNRYDQIDSRLDPRPPVGPVAGDQPHLRIYGPVKSNRLEPKRIDRGESAENYSRIEDVISWQKERSHDPYTSISDDPNHPNYYDPLSWKNLDRDWDEL